MPSRPGRRRATAAARARAPPAARPVASWQQFEQPGLVEHGHPEALGLLELGARRRAGYDIVGLLRHAGGNTPARAFDALGRLLAREVRQRAGQDERLARERPLAGWRTLQRHADADAAQVLEQRAHRR